VVATYDETEKLDKERRIDLMHQKAKKLTKKKQETNECQK